MSSIIPRLAKEISKPRIVHVKLKFNGDYLEAHVRISVRYLQRTVTASLERFSGLQRWQTITILLSVSLMLSVIELSYRAPVPSAVVGPITFAVAYALFIHRYVYVIPIVAMAWFVNRPWAYLNAVLMCAVVTAIHVFSGVIPSKGWIPLLNGANRLLFYAFLIEIIVRLRFLQTKVEAVADYRARALADEAARNVYLQRELLEAGQREQQRIGQDLHDGLCQHLTGTAIASQFLFESLEDEKHPLTEYAHKLVGLIENGINQTRSIAKGLYPIDMSGGSLMRALEEFTNDTSELFGISCRFACETPILVETPSTANHLYRIAQEAVNNAVRHGKATKIEISLEESDSGIRLCISDNGSGLPEKTSNKKGLGLRTMSDRARSIGGEFFVRPSRMGGLEVICETPG